MFLYRYDHDYDVKCSCVCLCVCVCVCVCVLTCVCVCVCITGVIHAIAIQLLSIANHSDNIKLYRRKSVESKYMYS